MLKLFISVPSVFYILSKLVCERMLVLCACLYVWAHLACVHVCVPHISAYHPTAHLHCQPLQGLLICIFAVPLRNHNKTSPECILGARRVYHRCPVSLGYTWNIWLEHVDNLSGLPSLSSHFLPACIQILFLLLAFPTFPSQYLARKCRSSSHIVFTQTEHRKYVKRIQSACLRVFVSQYFVSGVAASTHINRRRLATHLNIEPQNSTDACSSFCFFPPSVFCLLLILLKAGDSH